MRNLAIFGAAGAHPGAAGFAFPALEIDEMVVRCGIIRTPDPAFDPRAPEHARTVLARVRAFSCNYRDKGFMFDLQKQPADRFFVIGSEFVAEVEEVGPEVESLRPGDRVIGQNHYTGRPSPDGIREGIPTNHASRERQVLAEQKLVRIPASMPDEVAAGFSIGAQTAYSMVRKLAPQPGEHVLVTSATSNTSLFAIGALRGCGVHIYATTSSRDADERLRSRGVASVIHVGGGEAGFRDHAGLERIARDIGGFDCVVDPYFDLHLEKAVQLMAPFGRYITCGFAGQNPGAARRSGVKPVDMRGVMLQAMTKNLTLFGNCIGLREDLERALRDYDAGRFDCVVDSVFSGERALEFLDRTYNDRTRFGKVIFRYAAP